MSAERYVSNPELAKRSYIATEPKTWSHQGRDSAKEIQLIREQNERFGDALALQRAFGLRSKESLLIRPHLADAGNVLQVTHGTKGGRDRYVVIETAEQRELLERIKVYTKKDESLVPKDKSYIQFRNQYYYTLRKNGINRENGITAHGLRHEHLNELYQNATGSLPSSQGGRLHKTNPELDSYGRMLVAERAGHGRESISTAYIGGRS